MNEKSRGVEVMHPLVQVFDDGRALLAANRSVGVFSDPTISINAKLTVVPTMAFWVLAFGDAMALIRRTSGDTPLDDVVRNHAEEDAEHWRWFVADLELLAGEGIGATSMGDALRIQWGARTSAVRECAWTVQHLLRKHRDPVARLGVLEACEHGFEAFMDSIRPVVLHSPLYPQLRYLGEVHDAAEAGHALHEQGDPFAGVDWQHRDVPSIQASVKAMYNSLNGLHSCYADEITKKSKMDPQ